MRVTYHYRSRRPEQAPLRKRIREIAETRMRYGCRRITVLLRRDGWHVNVKRVRRLYRLEGLQMCADARAIAVVPSVATGLDAGHRLSAKDLFPHAVISKQNETRSRRLHPWKIRGVCSSVVH